MKKLLAILATAALAINCFATGDVGNDLPQSGVLNFTAVTTIQITNTFSTPYSTIPVVQLTLVTTNASPVTNLFVTTTNFAVGVNTTNSTVAWAAFKGFPRVQTGTNAVQTLGKITNSFATPFFYQPIVQVTGSTTNAVSGVINVTQVTTTNFVVQFGDTNNILYWGALGICTQPGTSTVTY